MVRRDREEKKSVGDGLFSEGSNRGKTKEKGYQGRGKSHGRGDLSDKECHYCKKNAHIQTMCKEFKENLKRRLGDVRYVPKFERDLILLGRLDSKGCTFKASGGVLKVIKGSLVLIKVKRSKRNLYKSVVVA